MDITISLQIKIRFDVNKKVSVGNVATAVKGLGLEQKVTEAAIQKADDELIEKYCGGLYARGNGNNRYQRAGTVKNAILRHLWENSISRYIGLRIKRKGKRGFSCPWKIG